MTTIIQWVVDCSSNGRSANRAGMFGAPLTSDRLFVKALCCVYGYLCCLAMDPAHVAAGRGTAELLLRNWVASVQL